jgi:hypothetical protein
MLIHNGDDLPLCPRLDPRQRPSDQVTQLEVVGCEKIYREKLNDTHAERPQLKKLMARPAEGGAASTGRFDTNQERSCGSRISNAHPSSVR